MMKRKNKVYVWILLLLICVTMSGCKRDVVGDIGAALTGQEKNCDTVIDLKYDRNLLFNFAGKKANIYIDGKKVTTLKKGETARIYILLTEGAHTVMASCGMLDKVKYTFNTHSKEQLCFGLRFRHSWGKIKDEPSSSIQVEQAHYIYEDDYKNRLKELKEKEEKKYKKELEKALSEEVQSEETQNEPEINETVNQTNALEYTKSEVYQAIFEASEMQLCSYYSATTGEYLIPYMKNGLPTVIFTSTATMNDDALLYYTEVTDISETESGGITYSADIYSAIGSVKTSMGTIHITWDSVESMDYAEVTLTDGNQMSDTDMVANDYVYDSMLSSDS
jgi:hypothetical protein